MEPSVHYYLPRIEWESLQKRQQIDVVLEPAFLIPCVGHIEIERDESYSIAACLVGRQGKAIKDPVTTRKPGELAVPFQASGTSANGTIKYNLKNCLIGGISNKGFLDSSLEYCVDSRANLIVRRIEKSLCVISDRSSHTEWYLNAPDRTSYCSRITERKGKIEYTRVRHMDSQLESKFPGECFGASSVDYAFLEFDGQCCVLQHVPDGVGPSWCGKLGIEFREDLGGVPCSDKRNAISELTSFILGRELLNVGYSVYDVIGNVLEEVFLEPWGDVKAICDSPLYQPVRLKPYDPVQSPEVILGKLMPSYIQLRDELGLSEALWRYWISNQLPLPTSLPLLATGVEILINAWFKCNKSDSRGVYLDKVEWDSLLAEEFESVRRKLEKYEYADRMLSKLRNSFQMAVSDRFRIFFEEIGLKIGNTENAAIHARNKMVHASLGYSVPEIEDMIKKTYAYRTLFHRVFLRLLGYEGKYVDYSTEGWPELLISEPLTSAE